nr:hypothetical protein [uncultured Roseateles sp.]
MTVSSIASLSQRVSTAVASYGDLLGADNDGSGLRSKLIQPNNANFTTTQADTFVVQYDFGREGQALSLKAPSTPRRRFGLRVNGRIGIWPQFMAASE